MKFKFLFPLVLAIGIGFICGKLMFNQYDSKTSLKTVFSEKQEKVYFIQQGVYSSKTSMEENTTDFPYYIYDVLDDKYHVYIGITKLSENANKLKEFFNEKGYNIYVKEINISNKEFLEAINNYDELLSKTNDSKSIQTLCNQILNKYEELVRQGEFKD